MRTTSQHVAGPWFSIGKDEIDYSSLQIVDSKNAFICRVNSSNHANEANARLIASAPELLYALKRAMAVISQHHPESGNCCTKDIATIKDAIAKAEGVLD